MHSCLLIGSSAGINVFQKVAQINAQNGKLCPSICSHMYLSNYQMKLGIYTKNWILLILECDIMQSGKQVPLKHWYTLSNKNLLAWNFLSPESEVTCSTVAIIIRVVLLSPYLRIRGVSPSYIHYIQSHRVYIILRQQNICLIWSLINVLTSN